MWMLVINQKKSTSFNKENENHQTKNARNRAKQKYAKYRQKKVSQGLLQMLQVYGRNGTDTFI